MGKSQIYSSWKMLKHLDTIESFLQKDGCPVCLQIDLTNKCNYACSHCSQILIPEYMETRNAELDIEKLKKFLIDGKKHNLKSIQITGGGEPTLHPRFAEIAKFILSNFEMGMVTNGSRLLEKEILNSMLGIKWIRISVDAGTREMYEQIHRCSCGKIFDNLSKIVYRIKSLSPDTILGFSFVISNTNFLEIIPATRLAKRIGFDNLRFSGDITESGTRIDDSLLSSIHNDLTEAGKLEDENFKVFLMKERTSDAFFQNRPLICYYAMVVGVITATGNMYHCCQRKNLPSSCIGSIYEETLAEIYQKQKPIRITQCVPCWMDGKNHLIEYIRQEDPLHVNFP